ncbi:MAG: sulfotransferase, partial [Pseudomonadota bacterium]
RIKGAVPPDVIVIGAMRAGTTTIYELMRATNVVSVARMKETDFFLESKFDRGLPWLNGQYEDLSKPLIDVSPNYSKVFVFPGVAERIYKTCPNAKLVYILRDPVKRALSEYRHLAAMGYDLAMPDKVEAGIGKSATDCSLYHAQLQPYLEHWSMDQIEIVEFEDLVEDQWGTLARLFDRLDLPAFSVDAEAVHTNSSDQLQKVPAWWGQMRNQPAVEWIRSKTPRETVAQLKSLFFRGKPGAQAEISFTEDAIQAIRNDIAEDVAKLRALTGRSFSRWSI